MPKYYLVYLAAIFFFLPTSLMFAEYGSSLKEARGGLFIHGLKRQLVRRAAFIGTFIWLASWIVWMVSTAAKVWIPFSTFLQGSNQTTNTAFYRVKRDSSRRCFRRALDFGVNLLSSRGIDKIQKFASFSGMAVAFLFAAFLVISLAIWFRQALNANQFTVWQLSLRKLMASYPITNRDVVIRCLFNLRLCGDGNNRWRDG